MARLLTPPGLLQLRAVSSGGWSWSSAPPPVPVSSTPPQVPGPSAPPPPPPRGEDEQEGKTDRSAVMQRVSFAWRFVQERRTFAVEEASE